MDSGANPIETHPSVHDAILLKSQSSKRSISSIQSRGSGGANSVQSRGLGTSASSREVSFVDSESKPVWYGSSRGADSEGLSTFQKEINDEDARLVYINNPAKTNEKFEFKGNSIKTSKYSSLTFLLEICLNSFAELHTYISL